MRKHSHSIRRLPGSWQANRATGDDFGEIIFGWSKALQPDAKTLTSSRAWRGIPYIAEILVHDGQNVNMTALIPHSLITNE